MGCIYFIGISASYCSVLVGCKETIHNPLLSMYPFLNDEIKGITLRDQLVQTLQVLQSFNKTEDNII